MESPSRLPPQVTARDRWLGWTLEQQLRRLQLVAQNGRFVVLPTFQGLPNLAARVLWLSLQRLALPEERQRWEGLVDQHHHLGCKRCAGRGLRHVCQWQDAGVGLAVGRVAVPPPGTVGWVGPGRFSSGGCICPSTTPDSCCRGHRVCFSTWPPTPWGP